MTDSNIKDKPNPVDKGLVFLFGVFAVTMLFSGIISPNQAMTIAENQVQLIVSPQGLTATATNIIIENGIYKVEVDISQGELVQSAEVYLTRDGKLLIVGNTYETTALEKGVDRVNFELDGSELGIGDPNAPITIIEFSDLQCPFCYNFYENTIKDLKINYIDTGKVYYVYKHFPLSFHPAASIASEAVECANEQDVWYEYHIKVFDAQDGDFNEFDLKRWAIGIVPDSAAFGTCLDSGKYADKVNADMIEGQSVGVSGTPATFVNGIMIPGAQPYPAFKELIDSELGK